MMPLPPQWLELTLGQATPLEAELHRELSRDHELYGRALRAIARRERRDDVLFASADGRGPIFWVHLTWAVETNPQWPWTETYRDLDDFAERWQREELDDA